jgi:hypothetical protein
MPFHRVKVYRSMASKALDWWRSDGVAALDEIVGAHRAIGGTGRGRRYATGQINNAYAVMLSSQFQRFCRDLHSEAADFLAGRIDVSLRAIFRTQMTEGRKLSSGNPNPANLGSDFGRFQIEFWATVTAANPRNVSRRNQLEQLNAWRNAIAHQDFTKPECHGRTSVRLADVGRWRGACSGLAMEFDAVISRYLRKITGIPPW